MTPQMKMKTRLFENTEVKGKKSMVSNISSILQSQVEGSEYNEGITAEEVKQAYYTYNTPLGDIQENPDDGCYPGNESLNAAEELNPS